MDPNAALERARLAVREFEDARDADAAWVAADELVDAFQSLDQWLSHDGFLPIDWTSGG